MQKEFEPVHCKQYEGFNSRDYKLPVNPHNIYYLARTSKKRRFYFEKEHLDKICEAMIVMRINSTVIYGRECHYLHLAPIQEAKPLPPMQPIWNKNTVGPSGKFWAQNKPKMVWDPFLHRYITEDEYEEKSQLTDIGNQIDEIHEYPMRDEPKVTRFYDNDEIIPTPTYHNNYHNYRHDDYENITSRPGYHFDDSKPGLYNDPDDFDDIIPNKYNHDDFSDVADYA